jgi:integrase
LNVSKNRGRGANTAVPKANNARVKEIAENKVSSNTKVSYASQLRLFASFIRDSIGIDKFNFDGTMPDENYDIGNFLTTYIASLHDQGYGTSKIDTVRAAVLAHYKDTLHVDGPWKFENEIATGNPVMGNSYLENVMKSIKMASRNHVKVTARAVSRSELLTMFTYWKQAKKFGPIINKLVTAALSLGFYCLFRIDELIHLKLKDLTLDKSSYPHYHFYKITLNDRKTDKGEKRVIDPTCSTWEIHDQLESSEFAVNTWLSEWVQAYKESPEVTKNSYLFQNLANVSISKATG